MDESTIRTKMQGVYDLVVTDLASIRTGRASPALVEDIFVEVYGGQQKLRIKEIGTISTSDPQTIVIDPWDKSIIGDVRQGLMKANIGMNPSIDGQILRISLPPLTTEDRENYVKLLSGKLENGRVMIRQIRADNMKLVRDLFDSKEVSEDERFRQEKRLQQFTDEFVDKIEAAGSKKEKEILNL